MGKAIIAVFFILAFVIFSVIKFAAKGVKSAYHAVNDDQGLVSPARQAIGYDDEVEKIVDIISGTLSVQKSLLSDEYDMLPDKAKDKWSLGYIGGYADALLQRKQIGTDVKGHAIMSIVFMNIFGGDQGPVYFRKFMDLQSEEDAELFDGMKKGGEEVFLWLSDKGKIPMGWTGHVRGF